MPSWAKWGFSLLIAIGLIAIGWRLIPVLVTLHIVVCFVLIIVIMLQSGSAADLAGAFGGAGSQTAFGPRGAATFLIAGDDVVRDRVHDDVPGAFGEAQSDGITGNWVGTGTDAEIGHGSGEAGAGAADTDSDSACAAACSSTTTGAEPGSQEIA